MRSGYCAKWIGTAETACGPSVLARGVISGIMPDMPNMPTRANPFQPAPGASPPLLVGRAAEMASISEAVSSISHGGAPIPMAFLGLRGLGKTVLLNEIRHRTPGAVHLHIEVETGVPLARSVRDEIAALRTQTERLPQRLMRGVEAALRLLPLPGYELPHGIGEIRLNAPDDTREEEAPSLGGALQAFNEAVAAAGKHLVITVDEIQDADVPGLRSLGATVHKSSGTSSKILFACAGLPEAVTALKELRTYAKTRWDHFDLSFLTSAETAQGIRIPFERSGIPVELEALDLLVAEAAGYPYFLQRYSSAAWHDWHHRQGPTLTLGEARSAITRMRPMLEKQFYAQEFTSLSPRERRFCRELALRGPGAHQLDDVATALGVPSSRISSLRGALLAKGVIYQPSRGRVEFRMPLADRYVREHLGQFVDEPGKIRIRGPQMG
ncbi:MAG: ATP-binding protein [Vulcanimicrobiaceae bacterium]